MLGRRYVRRIIRILALVIIVLAVYYLCGVFGSVAPWVAHSAEHKRDLDLLGFFLKGYIGINEGKFPKSEDELIRKGSLVKKKVPYSSEFDYYLPCDAVMEKAPGDPNREILLGLENFQRVYHFRDFHLNYGVALENLNEAGRKLYDRTSGRQILLIDGPRIYLSKKPYENVTHELYEKMLTWERDAETRVRP